VDLETQRLILVPLSAEHLPLLAQIYADPDVNRYIGGEGLDLAATKRQMALFEAVWQERGYGQSAVLQRDSGRFLGRVGLHPWPHWNEVEVGWVLAPSAQGHGYASEAAASWITYAFGTLGIPRLTAVIHPENTASQRVAARLGFHLDREDQTPCGVDVLVFERLTGVV
jgi:RimJ/RimL family protein N-acetyltransferase